MLCECVCVSVLFILPLKEKRSISWKISTLFMPRSFLFAVGSIYTFEKIFCLIVLVILVHNRCLFYCSRLSFFLLKKVSVVFHVRSLCNKLRRIRLVVNGMSHIRKLIFSYHLFTWPTSRLHSKKQDTSIAYNTKVSMLIGLYRIAILNSYEYIRKF